MSSSRGTIISSVIELHKDEEIYILVGQSGENACIRSMGMQDAVCAAISMTDDDETLRRGQNIRRVNEMYIENGGGGMVNCGIYMLIAQVTDFSHAQLSTFLVDLYLGGGGASHVFLVR